MSSGEQELMWAPLSGFSVDICVNGPFYREKKRASFTAPAGVSSNTHNLIAMVTVKMHD